MTDYLSYFLPFIATYIVTYALCIKPFALAKPSNRGLHYKDTATSGGIAIMVGLLIFHFFSQFPLVILISLFLITIIGSLDDKYSLSKIQRFSLQLLLSVLLIYESTDVHDKSLIYMFFSLIVLVYFINMVNFIDGIDGLVAMQAIFVFIAIYMLLDIPDFLGMIAVILGFLFFNRPPNAKIFLGSSGSYLIGYLLGTITIIYGSIIGTLMIILMTTFIVDSLVVIVRRFFQKYFESTRLIAAIKYVTQAHCTHTYQNMTKEFNSHSKSLLVITLYNYLWCLPVAYLYLKNFTFTTWYELKDLDGGDPVIFLLYILLAFAPYLIFCITNQLKNSAKQYE